MCPNSGLFHVCPHLLPSSLGGSGKQRQADIVTSSCCATNKPCDYREVTYSFQGSKMGIIPPTSKGNHEDRTQGNEDSPPCALLGSEPCSLPQLWGLPSLYYDSLTCKHKHLPTG